MCVCCRTYSDVHLEGHLSAIGLSRDESKPIAATAFIPGSRELRHTAAVQGVGERDSDTVSNLFKFVAIETNGLAGGGMFFERGDDEVETAVAVEILGGDVAGVLREGEAEEMSDFHKVGSRAI